MSKPAFEIGRLRQNEKLELIEELWESLTPAERDHLPLTPEQEQELDRRLNALESEEVKGLSAEDLRTQLKRSGS